MLSYEIYEKIADILNDRCRAYEIDDLYCRDVWRVSDVRSHRSACCSVGRKRELTSVMCSSCKNTMSRIVELESQMTPQHNCEEPGCSICKYVRNQAKMATLQAKSVDIVIGFLRNRT